MTEPSESPATANEDEGEAQTGDAQPESPAPDAAPADMSTPPAPATPPLAAPAWRRFFLFVKAWALRVRALDILPRNPTEPPLRQLLPQTPLQWISASLLWTILLTYLRFWYRGHLEWLFDPWLQPDDVRTAYLQFHNWAPEKALLDDPLTQEMTSYTMPGLWALARVIVPIWGVFMAPKVLQAVCLAIVFSAGIVLLRARRAGLASAALLIFFMLHTPYFVNRMAGGFGRGFAFPLFALWLAGAVARNEWARFAAAVMGALTQPNTVAIIVGAEGLYSVLDSFGKSRALVWRRVKRYAFMLMACAAVVVPYMISQRHLGHVHTLAEAEKNPAFGKKGRQGELPFPDPAPQFANALVSPYARTGEPIRQKPAAIYKKLDSTGPILLLTVFLLLVVARVSPLGRLAFTFYGATVVFYFLARFYAFRFYSPERYYSYGTPMAAVALAVVTIGLLAPKLHPRYRSVLRNFAASGLIIFLCTFAGDGIVKRNGLYIEQRRDAKLYEFVQKLPIDSRIATHPYDGDDIPWWTGRATMGGLETFQVWLVEPWKRFEAMLHDTYKALYATDKRVVLDYTERNHVTHFLLRRDRYGDDFKKRVALFEPITSYAEQLVAPLGRGQLVFANVPAGAIVYQDRTWTLVDVRLLSQAWQSPQKTDEKPGGL